MSTLSSTYPWQIIAADWTRIESFNGANAFVKNAIIKRSDVEVFRGDAIGYASNTVAIRNSENTRELFVIPYDKIATNDAAYPTTYPDVDTAILEIKIALNSIPANTSELTNLPLNERPDAVLYEALHSEAILSIEQQDINGIWCGFKVKVSDIGGAGSGDIKSDGSVNFTAAQTWDDGAGNTVTISPTGFATTDGVNYADIGSSGAADFFDVTNGTSVAINDGTYAINAVGDVFMATATYPSGLLQVLNTTGLAGLGDVGSDVNGTAIFVNDSLSLIRYGSDTHRFYDSGLSNVLVELDATGLSINTGTGATCALDVLGDIALTGTFGNPNGDLTINADGTISFSSGNSIFDFNGIVKVVSAGLLADSISELTAAAGIDFTGGTGALNFPGGAARIKVGGAATYTGTMAGAAAKSIVNGIVMN